MAVDEQDLELDTEGTATGTKSGRSKNKLLIWGGVVLLAVTLLVGGSVMATLMLAGDKSGDSAAHDATDDQGSDAEGHVGDAEDSAAKNVYYLPLEPPFVVNFGGDSPARFLQVSVEVSSRHEQSLEDVQKHMPVIRNNIVFLLSSQDYEIVKTREGKEKLRADVLSEIQKILKGRTGKVAIDDIYFTSFVMQ